MNKMKIRIALTFFCLVIVIMTNCSGNNKNIDRGKRLIDTTSLQINTRLQEYVTDSCILNLLLAIVHSNEKFYPANKFFYNLSFKKSQHAMRMMISVDLWDNSENLDYVGIIKIRRSTFLCRGGITDSDFFKKKSSSKLSVKLEKKQNQTEVFPSTLEPVLNRNFYDCKGSSVYIDVYTKGKIEGYP